MEHITNFTIPLPYVLGVAVTFPIAFYIIRVIRAMMRTMRMNEVKKTKRRTQMGLIQYTFNLSSGHMIQYRWDKPHNYNSNLEIYYGESDKAFEDMTYWGKLVNESTLTTTDWEVWIQLSRSHPPLPTQFDADTTAIHNLLGDGFSLDDARELVIQSIKGMLGLKVKPVKEIDEKMNGF